MAQPTTPQRASDAIVDGLGHSTTSARAWSTSTLGRLRRSIMPDGHDLMPEAVDVQVMPPRNRSASSRVFVILSRLVVGVALVLLLVAIGLFGFRTLYDDRIYPAVVVGDVHVGGLTAGEAEARLTERAAALETGTIAFSHGDQTWTPTLSELGATVELGPSIAEAQALGRSDDAAARLAFTGEILRADQVVPLRTEVDSRILNAWFDGVDRDLANPAIDARIVVEETTVSVAPDRAGEVVDRVVATERVLGALAILQPVDVELPTQVDDPDIRAADLSQAEATVREALSQPVRVAFEDRAWRVEADALSGYLTVATIRESGQPVANLSLDTERLAADLRSQFASEIDREPIDGRVGWNDERGLVALDPSQTGVTLIADDFAEAVAGSFLNGHERVEIPVLVTRPEIDDENLDALGIDTRLGRGDSNYAGGSSARDTNIQVGTNLLNGTLVRPGAEFSFNEAIGPISETPGWVEASVVIAERVGTGKGGGVCQVSTTVFRAALLAGMPITEWHPHTYRLQGYEAEGWGPGFDASILQSGTNPEFWGDVKFENWTDGWLLVEAWTSYPNVIVNIYGTDIGNTVEVAGQWQSGPITDNRDVEVPTSELPAGVVRQIEWPQAGLEAGFTRVIVDKDGNEIANREFYTNFKGRGNVYEVGTG
ncbi:MAG: VanW family protein [Chloroflexota bacterium]|nr:VanW family protein [Chloroflexota bacterium]